MAKTGRPVKYTDATVMQAKIDLYFLACKVNQKKAKIEELELDQDQIDTIEQIEDIFPTVTGLALCLDMTRQGLIDYENKKDPLLADTVKKAKARVEGFLEQRLYHNNATGVIFNLKNNYKWVDKSEKELSGSLLNGLLEEIDGDTSGLPED